MSYGIKKLTLVAVALVVMPSIVFSSGSKAVQLAVKGIKTLTVNQAQDTAVAEIIARYVAQAKATSDTVCDQDVIRINQVTVALFTAVVAGAASSLYYASQATTDSVENAILL